MTIPIPERFVSEAYTSILAATAATCHATVTDEAMASLHLAATAGYPHEVCGLLIGSTTPEGDWSIQAARQVDNLNQERASDRFQLDPAGYQALDRELRGSGSEILGVFHSHPDCPAHPSPTDMASAWEGFLYPIISICQGEVREILWWTPSADGTQFQPVTINPCASS